MTVINGNPANQPLLNGWQYYAVSVVRNLVGDISVPYEYEDSRLLELFIASTSLVVLDTNIPIEYTIDIYNKTITPDPSTDTDFMGLCSLRAACVLLNSEMRSKAGCGKVSMKDGPSTITMDQADLVKAIKDTGTSVCDKYEMALFAYKAGQSIGVAIMGPHSPASFGLKNNTDEHRGQ